MSEQSSVTQSSAAYFIQSAISFAVSFGAFLIGVAYLPLDWWQRGFLLVAGLFLVTSCFNLAKTVRDRHEEERFHNKVDNAKLQAYVNSHNNPLN